MFINSLHLYNFKNFEDLNLSLGPGFHFITGQNGTGKSNFLDSIYFLALGKSFIQHSDKELIQNSKEFLRIEADVSESNQKEQYEIKFKPPSIKEWSLQGKKYERLTDHIGKIPLVLLAPDDIYLLMHSGEARRKYLNQILVQTDKEYLRRSITYNQFLKQRNAAIRQMRLAGRMDPPLLDALDHGLSENAAYIVDGRSRLIQVLNPLVESYVESISNGKQQGSLQYLADISENFMQTYRESREKDYFSGRTQRGIHKDKIECLLEGKAIYQAGSQGQLKTFVAAMKLAQYSFMKTSLHKQPIVLFDDIFAKLDAERVNQLLEVLSQEEIQQCFITDTDIERSKKLMNSLNESCHLYQTGQGVIRRVL
ncbi:MAG: DNA replication and repair protein RecF [Saprospiraceae bacterium]|nr:DNA replication and repair protein RecF [Saprospiraceae bacterium]